MLPNGILGIMTDDPAVVTRFLHAHRDRCSPGQTVRTETLESGTVVLGSVVTDASECSTHLTREAETGCAGVFNGVAFDDWVIERSPHALLSLSTREIDSGANGMFLACAADEDRMTLISDPWGTMPVYVFENGAVFAFSSSLHALAGSMISDTSIRNGGGGGKPDPHVRNHV